MAVQGHFPNLKGLRLLRLLRIAKLLRLLRANRIIDNYRDRINIPFTTSEIIKLSITLIATCHWMACIWVMNLTFEEDADVNWLDAVREAKGRAYESNAAVYIISLYMAVMTISTVGCE